MNDKKDKLVRAVTEVPKTPKGKAFLGFFTVWLITMSAIQGGWGTIGTLLGLFVAIAAFGGIVQGMTVDAKKRPFKVVFTCLMLSTIFWFWFTGSYRSWKTFLWDLGSICIGGMLGTMVVVLLLPVLRRKTTPGKTHSAVEDILPACLIVMGWVGITLTTLWRQDELPRDVTRFARIGPATSLVSEQATRWRDVRVGLALSGGGYRAAVYHAGVLHALEKLGIKPAVLSTVSGGSIIGAYYSLGGDPVAFKDAVADGRFNLKRELLMVHNAVRLPFPITLPIIKVELFPWYRFSRRDVQAGLLKRTLFGDDESWRTPAPGQPTIVIATTDLTFGQQVGFTPDGAVIVWLDHMSEAYQRDAWVPAHEFSLSERVSMSGGFPLAFPAATTDVTVVSARGTGTGKRPLLLADGGIVDNSGSMLLQAVDQLAADERMASDVFLVSDAGAIFGVESQLDGLGQVMRAADVSSALTRGRAVVDRETPRVDFSAQDHFLPPGLQFRLYSGEEDQFSGDSGIHLSFDPARDYPAAVLEEIANLLSTESVERGHSALARYQQAIQGRTIDAREWTKVLTRIPRKGSCTPVEALPGLCDAFELRQLVRLTMAERLTDFRAASTLDDLPSRKRVEHLYALGQLLVYLQWPQFARAMDSVAAAR
jgi:NTE family protein